mgnify:FL=1
MTLFLLLCIVGLITFAGCVMVYEVYEEHRIGWLLEYNVNRRNRAKWNMRLWRLAFGCALLTHLSVWALVYLLMFG